jgi:hypothetical protein
MGTKHKVKRALEIGRIANRGLLLSIQKSFNNNFAGGGKCLEEFLIRSASGDGGLLFFQRSPPDPTKPIDGFWVRVTDHHLSAQGQVYAGDAPSHPGPLFADMARQWSGWSGELVWESLERELSIRCRRDRGGHIFIRVELRSGPMPEDWRAVATVLAEAGQLESIARRAELFFGRAA